MRIPWQIRAIFRPIDRNAPIDLQVQIEGWRRLVIWSVVVLIVLTTALFLTKPTLRAVRHWHARRLAAQAETHLAERNWNAAGESIRDAFSFAPAEPSVLLAAARLTSETGGTTQALELWTRVCDQPGVRPESRVELAIATIRAGRPVADAAAQLVLAGPAASSARGRLAASAIAFRQGDPKGALNLLREAVRLAPTDTTLKLQLASGLMGRAAKDKGAAAEAALLLYEAQKDPRDGLNARRLLRELRLQAGDVRRAREEAMNVLSTDGSTVEDRLALADILIRQNDMTTLEGVTGPLAAESQRNRLVASAFTQWLLHHQYRGEAGKLLDRLPPEWRRLPPLSLSVARYLDESRRVADLREHLRVADWTDCEPEREAWNARLAQLQNSERLRLETWAALEKRASGDRELMTRLLNVARPWRWHAERIRLLRQLASLPPVDRGLLEDWRQTAAASGQTADLCDASWQLLEQGLNDIALRADAARTAVLLGRRAEEASKLAEEVYAEQPGQPDYAATQAAAFRAAGKLPEALRVLAPWISEVARVGVLPDRIAFEQAATLAALGRANDAAIMAQPVNAENLLPEEAALLRKLRGGS